MSPATSAPSPFGPSPHRRPPTTSTPPPLIKTVSYGAPSPFGRPRQDISTLEQQPKKKNSNGNFEDMVVN